MSHGNAHKPRMTRRATCVAESVANAYSSYRSMLLAYPRAACIVCGRVSAGASDLTDQPRWRMFSLLYQLKQSAWACARLNEAASGRRLANCDQLWDGYMLHWHQYTSWLGSGVWCWPYQIIWCQRRTCFCLAAYIPSQIEGQSAKVLV